MTPFRFCLLLLLGTSQTAQATSSQLSIKSGSLKCSSGDLTATSLYLSCGDQPCTYGSDATISGTFSLANTLSSSSGTFSAYAVNYIPLWSGDVDICARDVSSSSGSSCPEAGDYEFETDVKIPGVDTSLYSSLYGVTVTIRAIFTLDGVESVCSVGVQVSQGYSMSYVGGAILLVGLAAAMGVRRRRVATIQLKEEEGTVTHFEMMHNNDPSTVPV